jgi:hypothetical protein
MNDLNPYKKIDAFCKAELVRNRPGLHCKGKNFQLSRSAGPKSAADSNSACLPARIQARQT